MALLPVRPTADITRGRSARQCRLQVGDQVVRLLDADRKAQEVARHRRGRALDAGAVLDQALDAAQRGGALPQSAPARRSRSRPPRRRAPGSTACRRSRPASAARPGHGRGSWAGRGRAPRPRAACPAKCSAMRWAAAQLWRTRRYSVRMPRSSSHASKLPRMPPCRARIVFSRAHQASSAAGGQRAGDHVGMAVQVLGRRVHDEVGAQRQGPGQHRGGHGGIDREPRAGPVRDLGRSRRCR